MRPRTTKLAHFLCAALVVNAFAAGAWGLDFGLHWDEHQFTNGLRKAINDLSLLPREYTYAGMYFNVGFLLLFPRLVPTLGGIFTEINANTIYPLRPEQYPALVAAKAYMESVVNSPEFLLEARAAYLAIACLSAIWVYLILRRLFPARAIAAVAGAAYIATSWEVGYHSRFIAVDAMVMQFIALAFLCIVIAQQRNDRAGVISWLGAGALCASGAMGGKMPGMFLIVPILTALWIHQSSNLNVKTRGLATVGLTVLFVIAFILTTPGSLYDPLRFATNMLFEAKSYNTRIISTFTYYVQVPETHARLALTWLYGVVPSPWMPVALLMSVITVIGYWKLWQQHRQLLWCSLAFALTHGLFIASNHAMVVRNWLPYVPLIAIAFGAGVVVCHDIAGRNRLSWAMPVALAAVFFSNVVWLWMAAHSVQTRNPQVFADRLLDWMRNQRDLDVRLSPKLVTFYDLAPSRISCSIDPPSPSNRNAAIAFLAHEHDTFRWIANRPRIAERTFGTDEVNYDYYPTWWGRHWKHRIVVFRSDRAQKMGVDTTSFMHCSPSSSES